jgi:hypothetical protein
VKPVKKMSLGELAAFVCTQLRNHGIKAVLSGGGCVSIYTDNRYESFDLDFIESVPTSRKRIKEVLLEIGFIEKDRYFEHPDTDFIIEFPAGPLAVGSEPVREIEEMEFPTGRLSLLSPTDCLEQALLVAEAKKVDLREILRWSAAENKSVEFQEIRKRLSEAARKRKDS